MTHSEFCRICDFVVRDYVAFVILSFGIMLHSGLCRIRTDGVLDYVVQVNVVRYNVVCYNVGV